MNCSVFQDYLQQRLDGETSSNGADIERHLAVCRSCRELRAAAIRFIQALEAQVSPIPPDRMSDQVVSRVLNEIACRRQARKLWSRRLMATAAVAAGLFIAIALGNSWRRSSQRPDVSVSNTLVKRDEKSTPSHQPAF